MIGVPMPNPRDAIIANLNRQMAQFFSTGKKVEHIARGVSADAPLLGTTSHHDRLRAGRDRLAPLVKEQADAGKTAAEAAKALGLHVKRVKLIGQENGFKFAEPS
ncbi:hypothetical protein PS914_05989 [Pseudomonas fluorescens]|uniref:hypothetical protein n=1 Tax=Pseudomonas fluorescens TaxID=294 RepID=UPI001243075C|nr:hypothetical protein [Pseudomonas fluorescens]VVQ17274.1 hypothetical protein PS914_05989 [Pseudomonas fluorescens]